MSQRCLWVLGRSHRHTVFLILSLLLQGWLRLQAHPISLSTAVADIYPDRVEVELRILVEDLVLYQELQANGDQVVSKSDLIRAAGEHRLFLSKYFRVFLQDGSSLQGNYSEIDLDEIPEEGVRLDQVMDFGVYYRLALILPERPDYLTFTQQFGGDEAPVPSVMDLILLQNGARLDFPVQLGPRAPHSVALDWENPPRNDRSYWKERREWMKQRRESLLGITSYSATYAYLYVEPHETRLEILVPLLTLETWLPVSRADPDFLSVQEQQALADSLESFLPNACEVNIEGVKVNPRLDRLSFYTLDIRDFANDAKPRRVGVANARVGMILSFPTKGIPQAVSVHWKHFNESTPLLNTMLYVLDGPGERFFFTENEPQWEWLNPDSASNNASDHSWLTLPQAPPMPTLRLPVLSSFCLIIALHAFWRKSMARGCMGIFAGLLCWFLIPGNGAITLRHPFRTPPLPVVLEQSRIAEVLVRNIYRAFDYHEDDQVYDALERSAEGGYLESLYLEIKKGLTIEGQGGAHSRVREVSWIQGEPILRRHSEQAFEMAIEWQVSGTVEHWGHIHERTHAYVAEIKIKAIDGEWKLAGMQVLNQEQIGASTGLRTAG